MLAGVILELIGLAAAFSLRPQFGRWCAIYAGLMLSYSLFLKHIPFLEALIVAAGMPLRALAGAALAQLWPSPFLMGCAYLLALFLVAGSGSGSSTTRGSVPPAEHRPALAAYRAEKGSTTSSS